MVEEASILTGLTFVSTTSKHVVRGRVCECGACKILLMCQNPPNVRRIFLKLMSYLDDIFEC
jgi:hypothetical protein